MSDAWYARYPGDILRDTAHLSLIEQGAHSVLLDNVYATGKPLPSDCETLYRICRAFSDAERTAVDTIVEQYFYAYCDHQGRLLGYRSKRADSELKKRSVLREKFQDARRKSWASRRKISRLGTKSPAHGQADSQAQACSQPQPELHSEPKPQPEKAARPSDHAKIQEAAALAVEKREQQSRDFHQESALPARATAANQPQGLIREIEKEKGLDVSYRQRTELKNELYRGVFGKAVSNAFFDCKRLGPDEQLAECVRAGTTTLVLNRVARIVQAGVRASYGISSKVELAA